MLGSVLPLAARIGEAEIDVFDVVFLDEIEDLLDFGHGSFSRWLVGNDLDFELDGVGAALACADADGFLDRHDENLAVADPARMGGLLNGFDGAIDEIVLDHQLDLHLGQEIDDIFGAAIEFGMALLTAKALRLGDGDTLQTNLVQSLFHLIQFERLDDGFDFLHLRGNSSLRDGPSADASGSVQNPFSTRACEGLWPNTSFSVGKLALSSIY